MASLQYLMLKLMICYSSLSLFFSFQIEASEIQYPTMHVMNKDVQTSECTPTIGGPTKLKVTHRHGPCSPVKNQTGHRPSIAEILSQDQLRVDYILARLQQSLSSSLDSSYTNSEELSNISTLPATSGVPLGTGNYIVQIGLGSPAQEQRLVFDTGSDLTWTKNFFPENSNSYSEIPCGSMECTESNLTYHDCKNASDECDFIVLYGDRRGCLGILSKETLTITTTDDHDEPVFPGFVFGFATKTSFQNKIDGLLGLSRGELSFVSQTAETYGQLFSYCLPSSQYSTGFLTFGSSSSSSSPPLPDSSFTTFTQQNDEYFYYIEITSISVGGKEVPIDPVVFQTAGNAIIDTGTVITRLPTKAYTAMRYAINGIMTGIYNYTNVPAFHLFDTCYDTSNFAQISVPTVAFTFKGDVPLELDPSGILYAVDQSQACLAFADAAYSSNIVIFGNTQQKRLEVVYDVANQRLGFRPNACN